MTTATRQLTAVQWRSLHNDPPTCDTGILIHQEIAPFSRWELMQFEAQHRVVYPMPKTVHESREYHPIENFPKETVYIDLRELQPNTL